MRFFLDNCISTKLARALGELCANRHEIVHLQDMFAPDTPDPIWLPQLASAQDLILVSGDPKISSSKKEREIWRESRLTAFFFGSGFADKKLWVQAREMIGYWPRIEEKAREAPRGAGYIMPFKGTVIKDLYIPLG